MKNLIIHFALRPYLALLPASASSTFHQMMHLAQTFCTNLSKINWKLSKDSFSSFTSFQEAPSLPNGRENFPSEKNKKTDNRINRWSPG